MSTGHDNSTIPQRLSLFGETPKPNPVLTCSYPGCEDKHKAKGYCQTHYLRYLRNQPLEPKEKTVRGWKGAPIGHLSVNGSDYIEIKVTTGKGQNNWMLHHRFLMELKVGRPLLPHENVHHMDGDKHNNHPDNLELWVIQQPTGQRAIDIVRAALKAIEQYPDLVEQVKAEGAFVLN